MLNKINQFKTVEASLINLETIAFFISITALCFIIASFRRKSGENIRASFSIAHTAFHNDYYISSLTLENLKDRSVVIFNVYLKMEHNYFLEIENFKSKPLVLKPFEAYSKKYNPVHYYSVNMTKINLNEFLRNRKVKKEIALSTSNGKYIIKSYIKRWSPIFDYLRNHMIIPIQPIRTEHKEEENGEVNIAQNASEQNVIEPRRYGLFTVKILGKISTIISNYKLNRKNSKASKNHRSKIAFQENDEPSRENFL